MENQIGIVTWMGFQNFGTYLQAYALRKFLERHGHTCRFVDDTDFSLTYIRKKYGHPNPLRRVISRVYNFVLPLSVRSKSHRRYHRLYSPALTFFYEFRRKHLPLLDNPHDVSTYIAGSDQIWTAPIPLDADYLRHFFLADFEGVKIAYAPSLGMPPEIEPAYIDMVRPWLRGFKAVSAREPEGARILEKAVGHEVPVLLDPTLLLEKDDWLEIMQEECPNDGRPYCFCYLLTYNPRILEQAQAYADRNGLRLIVVLNHPQLTDHTFATVSVGPSGFLNLLYHAEAFITDSFHGTIFSTIFGKPSAIFRRFSHNEPNRQNRRIDNFFRAIGSRKSMIDPDTELTDMMVCAEDSDWSQRLAPLKKESTDFLIKNLAKNGRQANDIR